MTKKHKIDDEELTDDEILAEKDAETETETEKEIKESDDGKNNQKKKQKISFFKDPKKRLILIISIGLFLITATGIGLYFMLHDTPTQQTASNNDGNKKTEDQPKVELFESPINGLLVAKTDAERHPLAVVVENHPDARPQSGLSQADIVYEAIAEGGITRFLAIFSTKQAEKVGPVRSARTFFVDWAHGYNAYLAHVGGNMDALDKIKAERTFDLDQFAYPSSYWREYAAGLATEHTMYTDTNKLYAQATKNNYSTSNNFNSLKFKDDPDQATLPESQKITVNFSSAQYDASFVYDKATNSYKRFLAGKAHNDKVTKNQLNPKNVVIMTVKRQAVVTRINEQGYLMTTVGTGKAQIFIDGKKITGTWRKSSASDREIFYDESGQEITFNRGQFWICAIPPESTVKVE